MEALSLSLPPSRSSREPPCKFYQSLSCSTLGIRSYPTLLAQLHVKSHALLDSSIVSIRYTGWLVVLSLPLSISLSFCFSLSLSLSLSPSWPSDIRSLDANRLTENSEAARLAEWDRAGVFFFAQFPQQVMNARSFSKSRGSVFLTHAFR